MKVVVDVDVLVSDAKTGVYNYDQRLLKALMAADQSNDYELAYFGRSRSLEDLGLAGSKAQVRNVSWFPRKLYNLSLRTSFGLPYDLFTGTKGDVYMFMKFVRWPLWRRRRSMVFVYDTAFVDYPEVLQTKHFKWYLNWAVPRGMKLADRVITISESTKRSLMEHYGVPAAKIEIVTPALDHQMFQVAEAAEVARVREQFGIDKPYVLSVATQEPRKNLVGLLRAFAAASDELRQSHALVLAGGKGWLDDEIERLYQELSAKMTIVRTGFVADGDLPALYTGASMFVFPSLYEGFGMPVIEAMACGAPVIAADNSSLPEAVGEAGILVDTHDTAALATAMERVARDKSLRAKMRAKGLVHAQNYHWERSAQHLLEIINDMGAQQ